MPGLSETLSNLLRQQRRMGSILAGSDTRPAPSRLVETAAFGSDPGDLRMLTHIPPGLPQKAPLVVVLHGCTQTAAGYDAGTGWSELAEQHGFAVLCAEQRRANNANGCFNWFLPADISRGSGEAASVHAMIEHALVTHQLDRARVFITGLSAGGAFANVMLATYPKVFAGGAIIAGLPYGAAHNVQSALDLMSRGAQRTDRAWGDLVRAASPDHPGPWPRIAVWHGAADSTVVPANATAILRQWLDVHGIAATTPREDTCGPATRRQWSAVESYTLPRLAHAVPISSDPADPQHCGSPAPFIVEAGLSSSYVIAQSWGLAPTLPSRPATSAPVTSARVTSAPVTSVQAVIHKALQAAGLAP